MPQDSSTDPETPCAACRWWDPVAKRRQSGEAGNEEPYREWFGETDRQQVLPFMAGSAPADNRLLRAVLRGCELRQSSKPR